MNTACSAITYYSPSYYSGDSTECATYYLHEGCFAAVQCSGTAVVSVTSGTIVDSPTATPTTYPTVAPIYLDPTQSPTTLPTDQSPSSAPAEAAGTSK